MRPADEGGADAVPAYWRATVAVRGAVDPRLIESLEAMALAASLFKVDADAEDDAAEWRVELLFDDHPDEAALEGDLARLFDEEGVTFDELAVARVNEADWLSGLGEPRAPLDVGRFHIHGGDGWVRSGSAHRVPLHIEHSVAFGSGDHASTAGCLGLFDRLLRRCRPDRVLDLGAGSAILAIAAARTGARRVVASDNDPLAVRVARENALRNRVAGRVRVVEAEGYDDPQIRASAPYDLVFANILADPLIDFAGALRRHLAPGGHAILAGLLDRQAGAVVEAHRRHGLRLQERFDAPPWTALLLRRPSSPRRRGRRG